MSAPRWRKLLGPSVLVFVAAVVVSLGVHLQAYYGIGVLEVWLHRGGAPQRSESVEIAFETDDGAPVVPHASEGTQDDEPDVTTGDVPASATPRPLTHASPREHEPTPHERLRAAQQRQQAPQQREPEPPRDAQHQQHDQRLAVTQRSQDPTVPAPDDARFLARENNHVEEETVASLRNAQRDDPDPSPGRVHASNDQQLGNADESISADMRNRQGSDARHATPEEAAQDRPRRADDTPPPNLVARGNNASEGPTGVPSEGRQGPARDVAGRAATTGGGEPTPTVPLVIEDGAGTWIVRVPQPVRDGTGPGVAGGRASPGTGLALREDGGGAGAGGRSGASGRGRGTGATGVDLRVAWSTMEDVFTPDQLRRDHERFLAERRSRASGSNRQHDWQAFRSAIENYVPGVRPGNQTALNAAASPFAEYLSEVHRRIHREFAERFLPSLPAVSDNPMADHSLMTKLEIVLERDGRVHRIGVVESSGYLPYDYGAFESVMRGQPYPEAPDSILSGDGRVYFRWGFYRNERQCGTFNAEPYILPHPPEEHAPAHGPLIDRPEPGGLIPRDARPTDGTTTEPGDVPRGPLREAPADGANGG